MAKETGQKGFPSVGAVREEDLKVCDLCSSLNLTTNTECFICGWNGHFEDSRDIVHTAYIIAMQQYGSVDLEDLTDIRNYQGAAPIRKPRWRTLLNRLWRWLSG